MANRTDKNISGNQKGRNGGKRPGAGRPKGSKNRRIIALSQATAKAQQSARTGETPLDFLLRVMRNTKNVLQIRIDAAKAAAPYMHARLSSVELNRNQQSESHEDRLERIAKKYGIDIGQGQRTRKHLSGCSATQGDTRERLATAVPGAARTVL